MQYQINGVPITVSEECGIYMFNPNKGIMDYATMDTDTLIQTINGLSKTVAIGQITALQNMAC